MKKIMIGLIFLTFFFTGCAKGENVSKNASSEKESTSELKTTSEESSTESSAVNSSSLPTVNSETTISSSEEISHELLSPLSPEINNYSNEDITLTFTLKSEEQEEINRIKVDKDQLEVPIHYALSLKQPIYGEGHQRLLIDITGVDSNHNVLPETKKSITTPIPDEKRNEYQLETNYVYSANSIPSGLLITISLEVESMKDGNYYPTKLVEQLVPMDRLN